MLWIVGGLLKRLLGKKDEPAASSEWEQAAAELEAVPPAPAPAPVVTPAALAPAGPSPRERLERALQRWMLHASPVLGRVTARRVEEAALRSAQAAGGDGGGVALTAVEHGVDGLVRALALADAGMARITLQACDELALAAAPLVAPGGPGLHVVPVRRELEPDEAALVDAAGLVAVRLDGPGASLASAASALTDTLWGVILQAPQGTLTELSSALDRGLEAELARGGDAGDAIRALAARPDATLMLFRGLLGSAVAFHAGPLLLLGSGDEHGASAPGPRALHRALASWGARRSSVQTGQAGAAGSSGAASSWDALAARLFEIAEIASLGGGESLASVVRGWGHAEDEQAVRIAAWLAGGGEAPALPHLHAIVALNAWGLARLRQPALDGQGDVGARLRDLMEGRLGAPRLAMQPTPAAAKGAPPGISALREALTLQIILGPPRARASRLFARGAPPSALGRRSAGGKMLAHSSPPS